MGKLYICLISIVLLLFMISSVSASDNSTDDFTFRDLTPINPDVVIYGEDSEPFPLENHDNINLTQEKLIYNDENFNVTIANRTIDGNATLLIQSNNSLNGEIYFSFLNNESLNLTNGLLTYQFNDLEKGIYIFDFYFKNNTCYYAYNVTFSIPSFKSDFISIHQNLTMYYKDGTRLIVRLVDDTGNAIKKQKVKLVTNGIEYERLTDDDGLASLNLNLIPGNYNIMAYYRGTYVHTGIIKNFTVSILPTLTGKDVVKIYKNGTQYLVKALDKNGNPLANMTLKLNINGVFYNRITNSSGVAKLNINLNPGNYIITVEHEDGCKISNNITVLASIISNDLIKIYKNNSQFIVKALDSNGNAVENIYLRMNINGVFYDRVTNSSGLAKLNINLLPGNYIITVENLNDTCMRSNNIIVTPFLFTQDLVKYYKNSSQFIAKLVNEQYKPISGEKITFNVNGASYDRFTDNEGNSKLSINLLPGEYDITTISNHYSVFNKITVLPTLLDYNPQNCIINCNKNETYDVILLDGQGRLLSNENVIFEYFGKKVSLKSDDNGVVRFTANVYNSFNQLTISYNGYSISNNVLFNR